jgi:hypothetical protein
MQRKADWNLPTTYSDGTPIPAEKIAAIVCHIYRDGVEVQVTPAGATSAMIDVGSPGNTSRWTMHALLDGSESVMSGEVQWTEPFPVPMPPVITAIS